MTLDSTIWPRPPILARQDHISSTAALTPIPDPSMLAESEPTAADDADPRRETVRTTLSEIEQAPHADVAAPPVNGTNGTGTNGVDKSGETVETMPGSLPISDCCRNSSAVISAITFSTIR